MFKRYRKLFVAGVAVLYAAAAVIFPDVLLPSEDQIVAIFDALAEAFGDAE